MQPMSKRHAAILDALTAGLTDDAPGRTLDAAPGVFMAAVIEKIGPGRFSVAHYFEQNGDRVADPDVEFVRLDAGWFPAAITQPLGYASAITTDPDGRVVSYRPRTYASIRALAGVLLTNIARQQRGRVGASVVRATRRRG